MSNCDIAAIPVTDSRAAISAGIRHTTIVTSTGIDSFGATGDTEKSTVSATTTNDSDNEASSANSASSVGAF